MRRCTKKRVEVELLQPLLGVKPIHGRRFTIRRCTKKRAEVELLQPSLGVTPTVTRRYTKRWAQVELLEPAFGVTPRQGRSFLDETWLIAFLPFHDSALHQDVEKKHDKLQANRPGF